MCTQPRYRPVGVACGGRQTNTIDARAGVRSGERIRASASAMVASGVSTTGSGVIRPPADSDEYCSSRRTGADSSGSISAEQPFLDACRQFGEQVGGVVRVHRLQDVRGPGLVQVGEQFLLVVLGQLLDDVGEPVVVHRVGDLVPQRRLAVRAGCRRRRPPAGPRTGPAPAGIRGSPARSTRPGPCRARPVQPTTWTGARRTIRRVRSRTASRETTQSRLRVRSIATSTTIAALAVVASWTCDADQLTDQPQFQRAAARTAAGSPSRWTARPRGIPGCRRATSARRSVAGWAVPRPVRAPGAACGPAAGPPRCREPCRSIRRLARTPAVRPAGRRRLWCSAARGSG